MVDLLLVVADKNMQFALRGGLNRPEALGLRRISTEFIIHPNRDGGVRKDGPELAALKRKTASRAALLLDYEGCGERGPALGLEQALDDRLSPTWGDSAKSFVIEPEVDIWMWGSDNALQTVLGWTDRPMIRDWLLIRGFQFNVNGKPHRPKEALEALLKELRKPRSSSYYQDITSRISLQNCQDAAFQRLRERLQLWFPAAA